MSNDFINITTENMSNENLCCIIGSKKLHLGVEAERLKEGHIFRKSNEKATVFIEYAPLETAWVPNIGDNYYDIQCPYVYQNIEIVKQYCDTNHVPVTLNQVDILQKAKDLLCVFNNWGVFYKGNFETVNLLLDVEYLKRILKK